MSDTNCYENIKYENLNAKFTACDFLKLRLIPYVCLVNTKYTVLIFFSFTWYEFKTKKNKIF